MSLGFHFKPRARQGGIPRVELNNDELLIIFDWYRLCNTISNKDNLKGWNLERWWYKPLHVCRKWRHVILASPTRLDLHLVCTYGIPVDAMLLHSPPLPLLIYYPAISGKVSTADEESAKVALRERERVRCIHFAAPAAVLCNLFKALDCEFPILERLSIRSTTESRAGLMLPKKLQASHLRHLTLSNIALPIQSQLLRQAEDLITLRLWNAPACPEFHPAHLVAQLLGMSGLEVLVVQFITAIPKRRFVRPAHLTPIILPSLKLLDFRGCNTYLEGILARINAPLLSKLNIEFFNQLTFHLDRLLRFVHTNDKFNFRSTEMHFDKEFVSVMVNQCPERVGLYPFRVQVGCQPLGWQAACAAQICHTLEPLLAGVETLTLGFHKDSSAPWQDEMDIGMWRRLLQTFTGVKRLQLTGGLVRDLFRSLQLDEGELPLDLFPTLQELAFKQVVQPPSRNAPVTQPPSHNTIHSDPFTLCEQATQPIHNNCYYDPSTFRKSFRIIGRAYQEQATTLIEICRLYAESSPRTYTEDDRLQKIFLLADAALTAAGKAKKSKTPDATDAFLRVQEDINRFGSPRKDIPGDRLKKSLSTAMRAASKKDENAMGFISKVKSAFSTPGSELAKLEVNFVILKSLHDQDTDQMIVRQEIDDSTTIAEIIWRFSRYPEDSRARITARQNPHFYLGLPEDAAGYGSKFRREPLKDISHCLRQQVGTIYVLVDKSCRLFLDTVEPHIPRIFGNLWKPHHTVILKDVCGTLESEDIVLRKFGQRQEDYWHRPSITDSSQNHVQPGDSGDNREIVKKPVENWCDLVDAALISQNVDLMMRDQSGPYPPADSGWKPLPSSETGSASVQGTEEPMTPA